MTAFCSSSKSGFHTGFFLLGVGNFFGKANVFVGGCGGILSGAHYHWTCHARGVWGHAPPRKFRPSEITSGAFSFPK